MRSVLLFLLLLLVTAPTSGKELKVRWRGKSHPVTELPADLPEPARAAIDAWAEWAREKSYRMDLEEEGRVLLISPSKNKRWKAQMKLVERVIDRFEVALPLPERAEKQAEEAGAESVPEDPDDEGPLPEDPEDPPLEGGEEEEGSWSWSETWGSENNVLDTATIVLFVLHTEADYAGVLERLAESDPYLKEWAASATRFTGFVLEQPLAGAYIETAAGMEEWDPDNEVVNRTAQLLLVRRFGQVPYWLMNGWAWHVEMEMQGGIYCFPYRDEFVWASEHAGWDKELATRFKERKGKPLKVAEFADWQRGKYEDLPAKPAWGVVEFLREHRPGALVQIVEAMRLYRDEHNRVDLGGGSWERVVGFEIPLEVQAEILREQAGEDFFEAAGEFFRLGKRYSD